MPDPALASPSAGIRYMAYSAFWFAVMSLFVKLAGRRLDSMEILFVRAVITLALSWIMVRAAGLSPSGDRKSLLALRGLLGFGALACFYFSIVHLPLADATIIQYTNPVLAALLGAWLLREPIGARQAVCVLASLAGVALVTRPAWLFGSRAGDIDPVYAAIALGGAAFSALAYVTVRKLRRTDHPLVVVFYFPLVSVPLSLPFALRVWRWPTVTEWLILLGVGVSTQIAQVYMTRGLQLEPAGRATAVGYLQVVFAAALAILFLGERLDAWTLAGGTVILGSTLLLTRPPAAAEG